MKRNLIYAVNEQQGRKLEKDMVSANVRYKRLKPDTDGFSDIQFRSPPPKIPWKAIFLATTLFLMGTFLIIIAALLIAGVIDSKVGLNSLLSLLSLSVFANVLVFAKNCQLAN